MGSVMVGFLRKVTSKPRNVRSSRMGGIGEWSGTAEGWTELHEKGREIAKTDTLCSVEL